MSQSSVFESLLRYDERWLDTIYVGGALFFTMSIYGFRHPSSAPTANVIGALGMGIALLSTFGSSMVNSWGYAIIASCLVVLGALGVIMAFKVQMTSMPQMVGLLNALGGIAAALESYALFVSPLEEARQNYDNSTTIQDEGQRYQAYNSIFYVLGMIIGVITFTGSITACFKLAGTISGKPVTLPKKNLITLALALTISATAVVAAVLGPGSVTGIALFAVSGFFCAIYGVLFVLAIGGADMPVVISVLNSLSGWSTVFAGLTFDNTLMIIAGTFVGASGIILSVLMCKAMNRSLKAVLTGGFGGEEVVATDSVHLDAHIADAEICAKYLAGSSTVYIIPGYGMAVSRAQHITAMLADALRASGRECRFAVHPVAGRLPGHMNVLLAEAKVPYDVVDTLEVANAKFKTTDTCIVIGANDTVNPAAVFDKNCSIFGMPVLQCWNAKRTIVIKRSMNSGYAGVENPLFFSPNTSMLLGDGQQVMEKLLDAFKAKCANVGPSDISATTVDFVKREETRIAERTKAEAALKAAKAAGPKSSSSSSSEEEEDIKHAEPRACSVGILSEGSKESRVMLVPKDIRDLLKKNWRLTFYVESGCGVAAGCSDEAFKAAGAYVVPTQEDVIKQSNIILKIAPPSEEQVKLASYAIELASAKTIHADIMVDGQPARRSYKAGLIKPMFISSFGGPSGSVAIQKLCAEHDVSFLSMDIMPRITTAQAMDVLSSTAKIAGYRAVLEAFHQFGRLPGPEITAAGAYPPAKVMVIGAGVAGLQAIGDAHRMGCDVRAFDVRKECADQVQSMGGKFLFLDFGEESGAGSGGYANVMSPAFIEKEMQLFREQCAEVDVIICTAAIPGRRAPILLKDYHVELMKAGSVLLDLAAPTGGNCESTKPNENWITPNGVKMIGKVDFVSHISAPIASEMLSGNIVNLFGLMMNKSNNLSTFDIRDPILRAITLSHQGTVMFPNPRPPVPPPPPKVVANKPENDLLDDVIAVMTPWLTTRGKIPFNGMPLEWIIVAVVIGLWVVFIFTAPLIFLDSLIILILGAWTGFLLVNGVTSALHTPLMSLTNAISGVVILAAMLTVSPAFSSRTDVEEYCAVLDATGLPIPDGDWACIYRGTAAIVLNGCAVAAATVNVFGGFAVTHRILGMFTSMAR